MVTPPRTPNDSNGDSGAGDLAPGLAGLAREVEQLQQQVQGLQGLPGQVEELAGMVTRLAETHTSSSAGDGQSGGDGVSGSVSWLDLPTGVDPEAARNVLGGLVGWMDRVYLRYADGAQALPECWAWHPDVVEELVWLQAAWQTAYRSEATCPALAGDWHDRARPGVVGRIKAAVGLCSIENHDEGAPEHRPPDTTPLPEACELVADWWAGDRTATPPVPEPDHHAAARARQAQDRRRR